MRGWHHVHLRKRRAAGLEPFPARTFWLKFLDRFVLVIGVIGPLITVPQILKIYVTHDAGGISILSWGLWTIFDIPWIIYGIVHREPPIIVTYVLFFIMNAIVLIEALIFGAGLS